MKKNLGEALERAIRRSNYSITEIARRLHVSRRTIYYWFKQEKLHYYTVQEVGAIIGYDFTDDVLSLVDEQLAVEPDIKHLLHDKQVLEELNYWKQKYMELEDKYNQQLMHPAVFNDDKAAV